MFYLPAQKWKITANYMNIVIEIPAWGGGVNVYYPAPFPHRAPLDLKSTGNGSIGIDLTSKKYFMKKYLFFFENELVKVENSWFCSDFLKFFEIPLKRGIILNAYFLFLYIKKGRLQSCFWTITLDSDIRWGSNFTELLAYTSPIEFCDMVFDIVNL